MEPVYFNENRYSYMVNGWRRPANEAYVVETPEGALEKYMHSLFMEGQTHLQHEEYTLALKAFQGLMSQLLYYLHPPVLIDNLFWDKPFTFPNDTSLLDPLITKTAEILKKTPATTYRLPN